MTYFRNYLSRKWLAFTCLAGIGLAGAVFTLRGSLTPWAANTAKGTPLDAAFYRLMELPGGAIPGRRMPAESREQLSALIQAAPQQSDLYALRAQENERAAQPAEAEADWKRAAETAPAGKRAAAYLDLAHFYERRVEPDQAFEALLGAAEQPSPDTERFSAPEATISYRTYEEALGLTKTAAIPVDAPSRVYESWLKRWPNDATLPTRYFEALVDQARAQAKRSGGGATISKAQALYDQYVAAHPDDNEFAVTGRAELAEVSGKDEFAVYDQQFTPLWPDSLSDRYYQLLSERHQLRKFVADARTQASAQPTALGPALRLYFYFSRQEKKEQAEAALLEFESRHEAAQAAWNADDLRTLGILFERLANPDEAARVWYSLYSLSAGRSEGLARLAALLLQSPEQHVRFGNRDLSLYANVAQMDRHPGFLNGILSVLFTANDPLQQYEAENETATAYFHRAAAADLIERLKSASPGAPQLAGLEEQLLAAYALYGQDEAIISKAPDYLNKYGNAPQHVDVALLLGDAYAHKKNENAEFALYEGLLEETAAKADHVPVGESAEVPAPAQPENGNPVEGSPRAMGRAEAVAAQSMDQEKKSAAQPTASPRSPAYTRVLDRYLSRLTETNRPKEALALYRREIDHNPNDAGLYERLAGFIEQNKFDDQLEPLYRDAMKKFQDPSWTDKLARFYLRQKRYRDYEALTKEVTSVFIGSELERYLTEVPPTNGLNDALFVRVNEAAHDRFPHNLTFVRNLLGAYGNPHGTAYSPLKREALLRQNWFYAPDLRVQFLGLLTASGRLEKELAGLPKAADAAAKNNVLALQFAAEGNAWLTHYETAAPHFAALERAAPGDDQEADRAISVHRSLADSVPGAFDTAVREAELSAYVNPHNHSALTRAGEIYADREQYAKAATYWNALASTDPRSADGYLEAATVFWDYYQFDDALRLLDLGRQAVDNPQRSSYEAGAIYENRGETSRAVDEYIQASLETPPTGANGEAQRRLLTLGRRKASQALVEQKISAAARQGTPRAVDLRIALLDNQERTAEIHQILNEEIARANSTERLGELRAMATRFHFNDTSEQALERTVALTNDPVERLQARLSLANFRESRQDLSGAQSELNGVLNENPTVLGVIRANVDFYSRNKELPRAVAVLENAAERAVAPYKKDLLKEAAAKATEGSDYTEARKILDQLLKEDPYDGDLLAAKANTYAAQGDSEMLATFYRETLGTVSQAPLPAPDKQARVAGLRRGYALALTKLERYQEGLDQYIEILNRYPEDQGLANEAAHYAEAHSLTERLTGYYETTSAASGKDYRWPLVLARMERTLRKYPEAISNLEAASKIRPDRLDLLTDKVDLEVRLLRFDDAIKTNQRLYELSYHSNSYLAAQAELHARLGHRQEAIQLMRKAYIDGRPKEFSHYATVADALEGWSFLDDARKTYEESLPLIAGAETKNVSAYGNYLQLLTIQREHSVALKKAFEADKTKDQPYAQQWAQAIGTTINVYYTPEEKAHVGQDFATAGKIPPAMDSVAFLRAAGLNDLLAQRLFARAKAEPQDESRRRDLVNLESSQLRFAALGRQLEGIAKQLHGDPGYDLVLQEAASAYRKAGDDSGELRVYDIGGLAGPNERYAQLMANAPNNYATRIPTNDRGRMIVTYLVATTDEKRAFAALDALKETNPLWQPAYDALAGVYWRSTQPRVATAFSQLLGPRTIGEQLAQRATWQTHLTGDTWFYYGSRFGEYAMTLKRPEAENYLPAGVEWSPAASSRYVELGDAYVEAGHKAQAQTKYEAALELSPQRAEIVDRLARLDWEAGRKTLAIEKWKQAFDLERERVLNGKLAPSFWTTVRNMLIEANQNRIVEQIKPNADSMFASYIRFNGGFNFTPFIEGILTDAPDRSAAIEWIKDLTVNEKASSVLEELPNSRFLTPSEKDAVYRELIARDANRKPPEGADANFFNTNLRQHQRLYVQFLKDNGRYDDAWRLALEMKGADMQMFGDIEPGLLAEIAGHSGHMDTLLAELNKRGWANVRADQLIETAMQLKKESQTAAADKLLEFVYTSQLSQPSAPASAYFGLAELRLSQKRNGEALALLGDVTLSVGLPFENLEQAGRTLEKAGLRSDAREYYEHWHRAVPWDMNAAIAAARLSGSQIDLDKTRKTASAPYATRVDAASAMRDMHAAVAGRNELDLLTQERIIAAQTGFPYAAMARLRAAETATDPSTQVKLLQEAIAIRPELMDARQDLSRAALGAKKDRLAVTAYESQPEGTVLTDSSRGGYSETQRVSLPDAARNLKEDIAAAYGRLGEFAQARAQYTSLLSMDLPDVQKKRVQQSVNEIDRRLRLDAANGHRAPTVLATIEQGSPVRPRLKAPLDWDDDEAPQDREGQQ